MIYLRQRDWQKAFDNAQTVSLIDPMSSWNWLFLAIAAEQLGRTDVSNDARARWMEFGNERDIQSLTPLLPTEFKSDLTLSSQAARR